MGDNMPGSGQTTRTIVWAIVVLFVCTMGTVVAMTLATDAEQTTMLVATIIPQLGAIAAVLVNLRATTQAVAAVKRVEDDTHALTNGLLDSKVRAGVAEVVHPELLDPRYVEDGGQQETDVEARDERHRPKP